MRRPFEMEKPLPETDYLQATIVPHPRFATANDVTCYGNGTIMRPRYGMDKKPVDLATPWWCGNCMANLTPDQYTVLT